MKYKCTSTTEIFELIKKHNFDFLDFGCSKGGATLWAKNYLNGKNGLGIDIDDEKLKEASRAGYNVCNFDILKLPPKRLVDFVVLFHFLEHIQDSIIVEKFINLACKISKKFVFIKQPFFDCDGYLLERGLKMHWSDWNGHPNRMTTLELYLIFRKLKDQGFINKFSIHGKGLISDSTDPSVIPLETPRNQQKYNPSIHPPKKKKIKFKTPMFSETYALASMVNYDHQELIDKVKPDFTFSSCG